MITAFVSGRLLFLFLLGLVVKGANAQTVPAVCGVNGGYDNVSQASSSVTMYWSTNVDATTGATIFSAKMVANFQGWIAWGFHTSSSMVGSTAVVAKPWTSPSVAYYSLNAQSSSGVQLIADQSTLLSSSVTQTATSTTLIFTRSLDSTLAVGTASHALFAYRSGTSFTKHSGAGSILITPAVCVEGSTSTTAPVPVVTSGEGSGITKVQAHGIVMVVAWLVTAPLGIFVPLFGRKWLFWIQGHMFFQISTLCLCIAGVVMGLHLVPDGSHFERVHGKMGIFILTAVCVQVFLAGLRPHATKPGEEKSVMRLFWEGQHRIFALALLACAYYNIHAGIQWASELEEVSSNRNNALYITIAVTVCIFALGILYKYTSVKKVSSPDPVSNGHIKVDIVS